MSTAAVTTPFESSRVDTPRADRWLHVVSHTDPRYGGLSSAVPTLAASLETQGTQDVRLAAFCLPGEQHRPEALEAEKVTFWPTSRVQWRLQHAERARFAALVRSADGLHVHGIWEQSTAVACHAAHSLRKPYVLSAHGMLEPWALNAKRLKKRIYAALLERAHVNGAACLHALTTAEAQQYRAFGARSPIAVVPNAVDVPRDLTAEPFLERFPALRGQRLVLFLSRLHPKKGLDLLLQSWSRLAPEFADAHLVLAGPDSDDLQGRLEAEAETRGIAGRVTFAGMLRGAMKWSALAASEMYVLPSYSEGLSMALLEAMGAGRPVIATTACNMPEIRTEDAGWEIEATEPALTAALREALESSKEQNAARGARGAALMATRYSPAVVTEAMLAVHRFALGGDPPTQVQLFERGSR